MTHKNLCLLLLCYFSINPISASDCDITKCPGVQKLYTELGCEPIYKNNGDCCPMNYECPDYSARNSHKCYSNGKEYAIDESLPEEITEKYCVPFCRCTEVDAENYPAKFNCGHYDCPEYFGSVRDPACVLTYTLGGCCSSGKLCGEQRTKAKKCHYEEKEYLEGQRIYPESHSCLSCLCTADFDNTTSLFDNPNCKESSCAFELRRSQEIQKSCIPVYYGDNKCCPIDWRCPNSTRDEVIPTARNDGTNTEKCVFGQLRVAVGDKLKTRSSEVTCSCVTPPFLQCIRERHPDF